MRRLIELHGRENLRFEMERDASKRFTDLVVTMRIQVTDEYLEMMSWMGVNG